METEEKKINVTAIRHKVNDRYIIRIECKEMGVLLRLGMAIPHARGVGTNLVVRGDISQIELQTYINEELDPSTIDLEYKDQTEKTE